MHTTGGSTRGARPGRVAWLVAATAVATACCKAAVAVPTDAPHPAFIVGGSASLARSTSARPGDFVAASAHHADDDGGGFFKISAPEAGGFGSAIAGLPDLNGDGIPDIVVGAPGASGGSGLVTFILLTASGDANDSISVPMPESRASGALFGSSLAAMPFRHGQWRVAVGSPMYHGNEMTQGAMTILSLSTEGELGVYTFLSRREQPGQGLPPLFGSGLAYLGEDAQKHERIAVGESGGDFAGRDSGMVHFITFNDDGTLKSSSLLTDDTSSLPIAAGSRLGHGMAAVGDVDGNGFVDLVLGGGPAESSTAGSVLLLLMGGSALEQWTQLRAPGASHADLVGSSVAEVGDVDNDGVPDVLVGCPLAGDTGAVYLVLLTAKGKDKEWVSMELPPLEGGERLGEGIATLGDMEGGGGREVALGAPERDHGTVYVVSVAPLRHDKSHSSHGLPGWLAWLLFLPLVVALRLGIRGAINEGCGRGVAVVRQWWAEAAGDRRQRQERDGQEQQQLMAARDEHDQRMQQLLPQAEAQEVEMGLARPGEDGAPGAAGDA